MKKKATRSITIFKDVNIVTDKSSLISNSLYNTPSSSPVRFIETPIVSSEIDNTFFDNDKDTAVTVKGVSIGQTKDEQFFNVKITSEESDVEDNKVAQTKEESEEEAPYCTTDDIKRLAGSIIVSTGTGLAMMPVFNHLVKNSESFGVDIHSNKVLFELSTANTFIIASFSSFVTMNEFIKKHQIGHLDKDSNFIKFSKTCASFSLILPLGLLWVTEVNNQKISGSSGFDEYMAWATFTTLPLVTSQIVDSVSTVNRIIGHDSSNKLVSLGGQVFVYGLSAASVVGRAISFTEITKNLAIASGVDAHNALIIGIAAGGVFTSSGVSILEYSTIKHLFEIPYKGADAKKILTGVLCLSEGIWFTLPLVSLALEASTDWNPLLKGALFIPLLASHTIFESTKLYENVCTFSNYVSDGYSNVSNWFNQIVYGDNDTTDSSYGDYVPDVSVIGSE